MLTTVTGLHKVQMTWRCWPNNITPYIYSSVVYQKINKVHFGKYLFYIYIIAEAERKWVPRIKEVMTNRKNPYLKFRHV